MDFTYSSNLERNDSLGASALSSVASVEQDYSQPLTHAIEYTAFLNLMLASIELDELCENYYQYLGGKLPLKRLAFTQDKNLHCWGTKSAQHIDIVLPCAAKTKHADAKVSAIQYTFARILSISEQQVLHDLHTHFCIPLGHALAYQRLLNQATTDALTGLTNRAGFDQQLQRAFSQFERHGLGFGLLVVDLDNFKQVNDRFGHLQGDKVLQEVAEQLRASLRDEDLPFRFGGDEFCCLINAADNAQLERVGQRILKSMRQSALLHKHGITASIGGAIATVRDNLESLFYKADQAVYRVKASNKNGVDVAA
ncbi:GGDEF domain-containing protein [Alteromonas flava]|uniref:GGDEF domain-containing protein n=1 Tax=Alteromonas flava TaxID=2048003 RepID=UPI000C284BCA|nr:GGDEF domain-containing protein [Alteromonas flava]